MKEKNPCAREDPSFNTNQENIDLKARIFGINHEIFIY
jgi:hypothetical protein